MGGLAANFSGKTSLSALGLMERLGSKFFNWNFAKCPGSSGDLASNFSGEISLSALGTGGGLGSKLFGEQKSVSTRGPVWGGLAVNFLDGSSLSTLGTGGGLGSELFAEIFAKYPGANGEAWQQIFPKNR